MGGRREKMKKKWLLIIGIVFVLLVLAVIGNINKEPKEPPAEIPDGILVSEIPETEPIDRISRIPSDIVKGTPENDQYPPITHSDEYEQAIPMPGPINTAGAEDAAFIPYGRNELYYTFVTDVREPAHIQIRDNAIGIWVSKKVNGEWGEPEKITLHDDLSLDGCEYIKGDEMYFCSVRAGYEGPVWFKAYYKDDKWQDWEYVGDILKQKEYEVGEFHITADETELYFDSGRTDGKGAHDIWVMKYQDGEWLPPENVEAVNTAESEGRPYVTEDGNELWFNRALGGPALYRSKRINGEWQEPELMISSFAGEPTLDKEGNVYFVHHFYRDGQMIEADIYVAYKR